MDFICTIKVHVDENKVRELGYDNAVDYLNDCCFDCVDADNEHICKEVRDYKEV